MIWLYLDPGSGSFLMQLLIASAAGVVIFIGASWRKIARWFKKNKSKEESFDDEDSSD